MEELNSNVFEQIKNFYHRGLTKEQESLIDKLIPHKELKERYKMFGLCEECKQPNTGHYYVTGWCQRCNAKRFKQNFKNWTSGNRGVDDFIQHSQLSAKSSRQVIEWIDSDKFKNVRYLAQGGFGTVYSATWKGGYIQYWDSKDNRWRREKYDIYGEEIEVALKYLHNSQDITVEFLREIESHLVAAGSDNDCVIRCYGITKHLRTNNFMMVMEYAKNGSLRQLLNNNFNLMSFKRKLFILRSVVAGLKDIHNNGLIHHDFHPGNVLCKFAGADNCCITDLGLCQPANFSSQNDDKKIHGVLPYVAPEVLRGREYSQASDMYSFGTIAYEICTGLPPHHNIAHDEFLSIKICQGWRPTSDYKIPPLILDVIMRCWDADPLKRPNANEIYELFNSMYGGAQKELFKKQYAKVDEINKQLLLSPPVSSTGVLLYKIHPQAVYISRPLDFKNLPEPKNADDYNNFLETESIMATIRYVLTKQSKQMKELSKL